MTVTEIEDAIYSWINGVLGIAAIFAYPNAPRPKTSYAYINVFQHINRSTRGYESEELIDESIDNTYSHMQEVIVSINTFYSGAYDLAMTIFNSVDRADVRETLWAAGLGIGPVTVPEKIPEIIDWKYEERARFDMSFFVRSEVTENMATIKKIQITNELDSTTTIIE